MAHNHEAFPIALPPSGTLTDLALSYQSEGTIPKHCAMKMQRRGLLPPEKEGQLSEVMTASGCTDGTGGVPSAHWAPGGRGCPFYSCSCTGAMLCSGLGAQGPCQVGGSPGSSKHGHPQSLPHWQGRDNPEGSSFSYTMGFLLLSLLCSSPSVVAEREMWLCCMTDRPSSSLANLRPYFERPLKEKGLCAPWMQGCWTAANPRLLHSKGWVNKWE